MSDCCTLSSEKLFSYTMEQGRHVTPFGKLSQANQNSLVFLNAVCLAEIQHIQIVLSLVWPAEHWTQWPTTLEADTLQDNQKNMKAFKLLCGFLCPVIMNIFDFKIQSSPLIMKYWLYWTDYLSPSTPSSRCRYKMYKVWLSRNDFMSLPTFQINTSDVCSKYTT